MSELKRISIFDLCGQMSINFTSVYPADDVDAYLDKHLPKDCVWHQHLFDIETTCGAYPVSNGLSFKFCPYCGGKLSVNPKELKDEN